MEPKSAVTSGIFNDGTADKAIDLHFNTKAVAGKNEDNEIWLKLKLERVYCIQNVIEFSKGGFIQLNWTCSEDDCNTCEPENKCSNFELSVYTEGDSSATSSYNIDCKLGNVVKLEKTELSDDSLSVAEIAIFGKNGTFKLL